MIVSEPPSSTRRAEPKNFFGACNAFASTPPLRTLPLLGHSEFHARASRVIEIKKDHNLMTAFDQTALCLFNHHLAHLNVACGRFIESRADNFTISALTSRSMSVTSSGSLIDQQHDHMRVRIVFQNGLRHFCSRIVLPAPRRTDDQSSLAESDWDHQIDNSHFDLIGSCFQPNSLARMQRGKIVKRDSPAHLARVSVIDRFDPQQSEVTLVLFRWANLT